MYLQFYSIPRSGKVVFTLRSYCVGPQIAMELQRSCGIK